jgi:hypothetical protein
MNLRTIHLNHDGIGATQSEEAVILAQLRAEQDGLERIWRAEVAHRKAPDYHTSCRVCGRFVEKQRWVLKTSPHAIRGHRPVCAPCFEDMDNIFD